MKANSLGSHSVVRVQCPRVNEKKSTVAQLEVIETELNHREPSCMNVIYDFWYVPNICIACLMVIVNIIYLVNL